MKNVTIFIILAILSINLSAQSVKKAYKSLEKFDYIKAKDNFTKILAENKEQVAANFGMAMVLADERSDFFNIVDSWEYIENIQGRTNELTQEELEILSDYFMATEVRKTSRPVKKKIDLAIEAVESRLIKYIREENDLEATYAVLEKYPDFKYYSNVVHIRNQFEFRKYEKINSKAGYMEFIGKYPEAAQVPKAMRYRNKMAFEEAKADNTVLSYNSYIKEYPESAELQQAIKLRNEAAFSVAKQKNTLLAYEGFIALYPDALQIPEARKYQHDLMYEKAMRIKTLEAYNEFIRMYPEGAYYIDVFNLKAKDLGQEYFQNLGFSASNLKWVKAFDNNEYIENAKSMAITGEGNYLVAGTTRENDSAYTDAWIIMLDPAGNMLWNKTIGQALNEEVLDVLITSKNEVIVVGYTQISTDSNDYAGWMFMLGTDGARKWNKNLGKINIAACAIAPNDKIYLATYTEDSVSHPFYIEAMNLEGQKIWERDYVRHGMFNSINISNQGDVLLSGSNWVTYTDSKFYIKWEDTLSYTGWYEQASLNSNSASLISSDSTNKSFISYSVAGKKASSTKISSKAEEQITELLTLSDNSSLVVINNVDTDNLRRLNSTGSVLSEQEISGDFKLVKVCEGDNGNMSYLLEGKDFLIVTFSSIGF